MNALVAAREVSIPIQTEFYALEGTRRMRTVVEAVRRRLNPELRLTGVIPTLYDGRTRLSREAVSLIRAHFGGRVFHTVIRRNVRLAEAPSHGKPITGYAPRSRGAADYRSLAREVLERE